MGAFLSGLVSGGAAQAGKNKDSKLKGILRKKPTTRTPGADDGPVDKMPTFKRGGRVRKTGVAKVHKGERVLTKKQAKRMSGKGR